MLSWSERFNFQTSTHTAGNSAFDFLDSFFFFFFPSCVSLNEIFQLKNLYYTKKKKAAIVKIDQTGADLLDVDNSRSFRSRSKGLSTKEVYPFLVHFSPRTTTTSHYTHNKKEKWEKRFGIISCRQPLKEGVDRSFLLPGPSILLVYRRWWWWNKVSAAFFVFFLHFSHRRENKAANCVSLTDVILTSKFSTCSQFRPH